MSSKEEKKRLEEAKKMDKKRAEELKRLEKDRLELEKLMAKEETKREKLRAEEEKKALKSGASKSSIEQPLSPAVTPVVSPVETADPNYLRNTTPGGPTKSRKYISQIQRAYFSRFPRIRVEPPLQQRVDT